MLLPPLLFGLAATPSALDAHAFNERGNLDAGGFVSTFTQDRSRNTYSAYMSYVTYTSHVKLQCNINRRAGD